MATSAIHVTPHAHRHRLAFNEGSVYRNPGCSAASIDLLSKRPPARPPSPTPSPPTPSNKARPWYTVQRSAVQRAKLLHLVNRAQVKHAESGHQRGDHLVPSLADQLDALLPLRSASVRLRAISLIADQLPHDGINGLYCTYGIDAIYALEDGAGTTEVRELVAQLRAEA